MEITGYTASLCYPRLSDVHVLFYCIISIRAFCLFESARACVHVRARVRVLVSYPCVRAKRTCVFGSTCQCMSACMCVGYPADTKTIN